MRKNGDQPVLFYKSFFEMEQLQEKSSPPMKIVKLGSVFKLP